MPSDAHYYPLPSSNHGGSNKVSDRPANWIWEKTDPARSGSSGDLSKLFRHEETKNPGAFAYDAPPMNATLMAREVIQNSWDAARELQDSDQNAPEFEIVFKFEELKGDEKYALAESLDLVNLAARAESADRADLGLRETDCLGSLFDPDPLPVLIIEERGTTGMYGPWTGANSRMFLGLVSLGYTEKAGVGAGGSYGFGKAGLIRGSATRTVIAYTCFRERADDPGVTRRLLGMTYWGQHDDGDVNYTGFARYGEQPTENEGVKPFENERADEVAVSLGLDRRDSDRPEDLGTTFILIEPTVEPAGLVKAIERSWWPALTDRLFEVSVRSSEGLDVPRPLRDDVLRSFVRAYEVATVPRDNPKAEEKKIPLSSLDVDGERVPTLGNLGLTVDLQDWSYADQKMVATDDGAAVDHRSLVALIRGPRMIVEYLDVGRTAPYVRGAFIADLSIDDYLRRTEPKSHDSWQAKSDDGGLDSTGARIADTVRKRIKANVATFRKLHKPPVPPPEDIHLPLFDSIMRKVMSGTGAGWKPPIHDTRPVSIRLKHAPEAAGHGLIRLRGSATFSLSDHFEGESGEVEASIFYRFLEDDRVGEYADLEFTPSGLLQPIVGDAGKFNGRMAKGDEVEIAFVSAPYSAEWSGRLIVNGDPSDANRGDDE